MTPVYSGGLVYEYTVEGDAKQQKFGLVDIQGGKAVEQPDFSSLQSAFKATPLPTGDGGYKSSGNASTCPTASSTWLVGNDSLPAMPPQASQYFKDGAGKGQGLQGGGSQDWRGEHRSGDCWLGQADDHWYCQRGRQRWLHFLFGCCQRCSYSRDFCRALRLWSDRVGLYTSWCNSSVKGSSYV